MAQVTDNQLDKIATNIVDRFLTEKVALTEGVVDAAKEENFNPEQIKRLVESVNNMTFLRKFNNAEEGAEDRMVEFETANPNAAIQRLLDAAKDVMSSVSGMGGGEDGDRGRDSGHDSGCGCGDLEDALPTSRPDAPPPLDPLEGEEIRTASEPKIRGTVMIMKLRKTAEELKNKAYEKRYEFTEALQKTASHFRTRSPEDFAAFEKDALYKWGSDAEPYLQTLRGALRMVPVIYNVNALTKVGRVIDSSSPPMRLFSELLRTSQDIDTVQKGIEKTAAWLRELSA